MIPTYQQINKHKVLRQILSLSLAFVIGVSFAWSGQQVQQAKAQFIQPELIAPVVYQRLPELPLENQYQRKETGEVDTEQTLARRLIHYHIYVKDRSPYFRLDWKLTLADYLGANERIESAQYSGSKTLKENPLPRDTEIIRSFNRSQREELVNVMVGIFNRDTASDSTATPTIESSPPPTPSLPRNNRPSLPQPGDAQLLLP